MAASDYSAWKRRKEENKVTLASSYSVLGFISSGTYGKVYKARKVGLHLRWDNHEYAIKVFKIDSQESNTSGISQSACREIALCRGSLQFM